MTDLFITWLVWVIWMCAFGALPMIAEKAKTRSWEDAKVVLSIFGMILGFLSSPLVAIFVFCSRKGITL